MSPHIHSGICGFLMSRQKSAVNYAWFLSFIAQHSEEPIILCYHLFVWVKLDSCQYSPIQSNNGSSSFLLCSQWCFASWICVKSKGFNCCCQWMIFVCQFQAFPFSSIFWIYIWVFFFLPLTLKYLNNFSHFRYVWGSCTQNNICTSS